jgi:hypothetical protein
MKSYLVKLISIVLLTVGGASLLSGCIGSNVATSKVLQFNMEVVDNKYARGGVNILLTPVYALTTAVDLLIFNSIEFWTGESPLNGEKHIFDSHITTIPQQVKNENILSDDSFLYPRAKIEQTGKKIYSVQATLINQNIIDYHIIYNNGDSVILREDKLGDVVNFYLDGQLITIASIDELTSYTSKY